MATLYDTLGCSPSASAAELKARYRIRVQELHPDRHTAHCTPHTVREMEQALAEVNAAYAVLGEPARRAEYDAKPASGVQSAVSAPSHRGRPGGIDGAGRVMRDMFRWREAPTGEMTRCPACGGGGMVMMAELMSHCGRCQGRGVVAS